MCYQLLQIFECGHNNGSDIIKCEKPTSKCGGIFLRQELEETKGLCESCQRAENARKSKSEKSEAEDEGYWS